jgi:phosphatidylglycerol---prolipoprotein diacylglyceryl transferase
MCSELLRIPINWNGVPVFGFGLVLLAWLAVSAFVMVSTAKQADWPTSLRMHLPTVAIIAALIVWIIPRFLPGGVPLRGYGLMVLAGIVAGIAMSIHRALQVGLDADDILGLALWTIPGGAIGGRLFYVVQYWDGRIRQADPWDTIKNVLAFTEGGLVVYGAFVGAMVGMAIYVWRRKLPALAMADLIAPGMMVGLSLGRIGCLLNGCCYGGETDLPWAVRFPRESSPQTLSGPYAEQASLGRFHGFQVGAKSDEAAGVVVERVAAGSPADKADLRAGDVVTQINGVSISTVDDAHAALVSALRDGEPLALRTDAGVRTIAALDAPPRSLPVHPTQVYSAIDAGLLAWVLWSYYPFRRRDGEVMALMMTVHPASRFLLEAIRVDEAPVWGTGLSIAQNLSVILLIVACGMWFALRRNPVGRLALPPSPASAA